MSVPKRSRRRPVAGATLLAGVALALLAGGCGASKFTKINETASDFYKQVLHAEEPVLVEFFKGGCATCGLLEPTLDQLADEYKGKLKFVSFEMMRAYFTVSCPEVQKKQRIAYYPTVILYVKGEEKKRWIIEYGIDSYRTVLNETVGGPTPKDPDTKAAGGPKAEDGKGSGQASPAAVECMGVEAEILSGR
jgi:thioredoxin 1